MQALESLNDSQVNDFLSGKTPLNLSMRLGDHMMLIQLQLSTVNPSSSPSTSSTASASSRLSRSSKASLKSKLSALSQQLTQQREQQQQTAQQPQRHHQPQPSTSTSHNFANNNNTTNTNFNIVNSKTTAGQTTTMCTNTSAAATEVPTQRSRSLSIDLCSITDSSDEDSAQSSPEDSGAKQNNIMLISKEFENLKNIVNSLSAIQTNVDKANSTEPLASTSCQTIEEQSPIKSLSNLVSNPIKTTPIKIIPIVNSTSSTITNISDPITAKLTSCICKRLDASGVGVCDLNCQLQQQQIITTETTTTFGSSSPTPSTSGGSASKSLSFLHRTTNNPIAKNKQRHSPSTISNSACTATIHHYCCVVQRVQITFASLQICRLILQQHVVLQIIWTNLQSTIYHSQAQQPMYEHWLKHPAA